MFKYYMEHNRCNKATYATSISLEFHSVLQCEVTVQSTIKWSQKWEKNRIYEPGSVKTGLNQCA